MVLNFGGASLQIRQMDRKPDRWALGQTDAMWPDRQGGEAVLATKEESERRQKLGAE